MTSTTTIRPFDQDPTEQYIDKLSNHLFDYVMPTLSPTAWMVLCFIIRKTTGWQKESDDISIGDIKQGTNIKSDATVVKAISDLEEKRYITATHRKKTRQANTYKLNTTLKIEVEATPKIEVDSKTTTKNEVVTTTKNEVSEALTTTKNEDTKEQYLNNKGKERAREEISSGDPLTDVVNGQGKYSEHTGTNPDDQWFDFRDRALEAFPGNWGRTPQERQIKRGEILGFVADLGEKFNPDHWEFIIKDCIAHGVGANNIARFKEAYQYPDYNAYLAEQYPKSTNGGRDSPGSATIKTVWTDDGGVNF